MPHGRIQKRSRGDELSPGVRPKWGGGRTTWSARTGYRSILFGWSPLLPVLIRSRHIAFAALLHSVQRLFLSLTSSAE